MNGVTCVAYIQSVLSGYCHLYTIDIIANGTGLETDDVMRPTSVTGARFLDPT